MIEVIVGVTQEQEIGLDRQLGNKKRDHGVGRRPEQLDETTDSVETRGVEVVAQGIKRHMRMFAAGQSAAGAYGRVKYTENAHWMWSCAIVVIILVI